MITVIRFTMLHYEAVKIQLVKSDVKSNTVKKSVILMVKVQVHFICIAHLQRPLEF